MHATCLQVNFDKIWDGMQPQLTSLVSGVPQTLTNEKWMEMYSYVEAPGYRCPLLHGRYCG